MVLIIFISKLLDWGQQEIFFLVYKFPFIVIEIGDIFLAGGICPSLNPPCNITTEFYKKKERKVQYLLMGDRIKYLERNELNCLYVDIWVVAILCSLEAALRLLPGM